VSDETATAGISARPAPALAPGATLGKYRLDHVLGSGGMGVVWAAHDPDLDRAVALKVLRYEHAPSGLRVRLQREARAMARLKHLNVLTVYEAGSDGDRDYIAMELVDGESLEVWIATPQPEDELWDALLAAGRGLAAAHDAGLVHRDFKPGNVLRRRDGRVLVTDFGLARGLGDDRGGAGAEPALPDATALDATIDASPSPSPRADSVLHSPLTATGAVLGTPAYMAPEQFRGAASDARTDQFAYCITAWQLLTGERPFRGDTLEELKRATSAGVARLRSTLAPAVRAVLARGLSPEPDARWPDMTALLAALEDARHLRRRRVRAAIAAIAVAVVVAAGVFAWRTRGGAAATSALCTTSPEDEIALAWSPEFRKTAPESIRALQGFAMVADELDAFAAAWVADYRGACAVDEHVPKTYAKLGCLLGERDEVAALTHLMPVATARAFDDVEMGGVLPRTQACDGDSPVTPPTLPDDPDKRRRIEALRRRLLASHFEAVDAMLPTLPGLLEEARAIDWEPILAEAEQAVAVVFDRSGRRWEEAREHYRAANELARRTHHYHLEADSWIGLLGNEFEAASDPGDGKKFDDLVARARLAVHNSGDDPVYLAHIAHIEAAYALSRGRRDDAVALEDRARRLELAARDFAMATRVTSGQAQALALRDGPTDLDEAWRLMGEAIRVGESAKLVPRKLRAITDELSLVAQLRGDLANAHAWADRGEPPRAPRDAVSITGRVVDADGRAVAGARVVAWRGELAGDAERAYVWPTFEGAVATTDATGAFSLRGARGGAIIAELGDRRSRPREIGDAPVELALAPTRAIAGRVACDDELAPGVAVAARYAIGSNAWSVVAALGRGRDYRLAGLPPGDATLRLDAWLDSTFPKRKLDFGPVRDDAALTWPVGPTIDVIVRGGSAETPMIWLLRGRVEAKTRADVEAIAERETQGLRHQALVIGIGDQTQEGIAKYARGDRHGLFFGNAPGAVTVCVADGAATSKAMCQVIEVPAGAKIAVRDGRGVYPAIPVVIERQ
jgi:hypothetical protein